MKKIFTLLISLLMFISLAACSKKTADYSNQTLVGQIKSISDTSITLNLGEVKENEMMGGGEMPSGEGQSEPPAKPEGESQGDNTQGNPPEMPSGEMPSGDGQNEPPAKPEGESQGDNTQGNPPEMPSGEGQGQMMGGTSYSFTANGETATVDLKDTVVTLQDESEGTVKDLKENDVIEIVFGSNNTITSVKVYNTNSSKGGDSKQVDQGSSANTISENKEVDGESYSSTGDDENALRIDGATVTLNNITVNKQEGSSSNAENGDFYGVNAAVLATNGANVTITNSNISSSAQNGNGVFSYGSGTVVNISDSTINTTKDNSGGIQTTGGGTTNASNLTVNTEGSSAAAIRSDRGGGTVVVNKGTYTSNGLNSPAVYSTADITVSDATLTANNSEALVIEGKNSIKLNNCEVSGKMSEQGSSADENIHNVMIYQSMSGDADVGTSSFVMNGGSLTSNNGDMIYVTNTNATIDLTNVNVINNASNSYFLRIVGNSSKRGWGNAGSNGGNVEMTMSKQTLDGDILVDDISTLNLTLKDNSTFNGSMNIGSNAQASSRVDNNIVVTIEKGSTWNLTSDCVISSITNNGTINYNGHTITLADGTVMK